MHHQNRRRRYTTSFRDNKIRSRFLTSGINETHAIRNRAISKTLSLWIQRFKFGTMRSDSKFTHNGREDNRILHVEREKEKGQVFFFPGNINFPRASSRPRQRDWSEGILTRHGKIGERNGPGNVKGEERRETARNGMKIVRRASECFGNCEAEQ